MSNIIKTNSPFDLVDPFFEGFFNKNSSSQVMKTDVKDNGDHYELKVELPEIKKEDIHLSLNEGYLNIEASIKQNNDESKHGHYIRKERYYGNFSRSFYVGEKIHQEDIKAKLADGVLTLLVPKEKEEVNQKKYIEIE